MYVIGSHRISLNLAARWLCHEKKQRRRNIRTVLTVVSNWNCRDVSKFSVEKIRAFPPALRMAIVSDVFVFARSLQNVSQQLSVECHPVRSPNGTMLMHIWSCFSSLPAPPSPVAIVSSCFQRPVLHHADIIVVLVHRPSTSSRFWCDHSLFSGSQTGMNSSFRVWMEEIERVKGMRSVVQFQSQLQLKRFRKWFGSENKAWVTTSPELGGMPSQRAAWGRSWVMNELRLEMNGGRSKI